MKTQTDEERVPLMRRELLVARATSSDLGAASLVMRSVLDSDLGGYQTRWHADLDDLQSAYLETPGRALFLARIDGVPAGTAAVRPCRLSSPPNPQWLVEQYADPSVCELVRVWIRSSHRRMGVAGALVRQAVDWAVNDAGYQTVYLHTDASVSGAEPFWRSMPTVEVHDARPDPFNCVHFELDPVTLLGEVEESRRS